MLSRTASIASLNHPSSLIISRLAAVSLLSRTIANNIPEIYPASHYHSSPKPIAVMQNSTITLPTVEKTNMVHSWYPDLQTPSSSTSAPTSSTAAWVEKVFADPYGTKLRLLKPPKFTLATIFLRFIAIFFDFLLLHRITRQNSSERESVDILMLVLGVGLDVLLTAGLVSAWVMYFKRPGRIGNVDSV